MLLKMKPKETKKEADDQPMANSEEAREQDNLVKKYRKLIGTGVYYDEEAGEYKGSIIEESVEDSNMN